MGDSLFWESLLRDEVLTAAEVAEFLRSTEQAVLALVAEQAIPAQRVGGEWRFLKRAVVDWLGNGQRVLGYPPLEELLLLIERRLADRPDRQGPKRGSKEAVLRHYGVFKDETDLEERLADLERRRARGGE